MTPASALFMILILPVMTIVTGSICAFLESMIIIPCKNGAECQPVGTSEFRCQCLNGYSGKLCQIDIDECASNPCLNGGTCIDGINGYNCSCPESFTGQTCEIEINACKSSPCKNRGICENRGAGYACSCQFEFDCTKHRFAIIGGSGCDNKVSYWNSCSSLTKDTELKVTDSLFAHAATALHNGSILVTGGFSLFEGLEACSTSYTIELGSNKAKILNSANIPGKRYNHGAVLLPDGHVLLCGGSSSLSDYLDLCFTYNGGAWRPSAPMLSARSGRFGMASDGEYVYVVGGWVGTNTTNSAERYDPARNRWESIPSLLGSPISYLSLVHVNGKLYAIGGNNETGATSRVHIYDIPSGTWSLGPELNHPREDHSALTTPDGSLWVFGGSPMSDTVEVLPAGAEYWILWPNVLPRNASFAQVLWVNKTIIGDSDRDTGDDVSFNYDC